MHYEYDGDYLDECHQNRTDSAGGGHIQEYAKNVDWEQRDDETPDGELYHIAEVAEKIPESACGVRQNCAAEAQKESQNQSRHHRHERFHRDGEIGHRRAVGHRGGIRHYRPADERWKDGIGDRVRHHAGAECHEVGNEDRDAEHRTCAAPYVGYGRRYESHDQKRDYEAEQRTENGGKSGEYSAEPHRRDKCHGYAEDDGYAYAA